MVCLLAGAFVVSESGGDGIPPSVVAIRPASDHRLLVMFARAVDTQSWPRAFRQSSACSSGILTDEADSDGTSSAGDMFDLHDALDGVRVARPIRSIDIDRLAVTGACDVLHLIDPLNRPAFTQFTPK